MDVSPRSTWSKTPNSTFMVASPRPVEYQPVGAGLRRPHFAAAAEDLAHARVRAIARERLEPLGLGIEAHHRVGAEVAEPHLVVFVDVHGVGLRPLARQLPRLPLVALRIVAAHVARVPLADPDPALRVRPDAPRALVLR